MKIGFDKDKYLKLQTEKILERVKNFDNKLYIEFGGKLFDEFHGSRVLPGLEPDIKIQMLDKIKDKIEIMFCINANDIESNRIRSDSGLTYDIEVLRLIDLIRSRGLFVNNIIITLYNGQPSALKFGEKLKEKGENVYYFKYTKGYPTDVKTIVSEEGYGANPFAKTIKPIVVVTAPGAKSGKLGVCLSQLYHEYINGTKAGYTKFETFPVWNLPLKHPVNVAYEAATADIKDINMIDPYYLTSYNKLAVNYNRDIEIFPVVNEIISKITSIKDYYKSPTDMGVNMIGYCISDDDVVCEASKQEIIRRYYKYLVEYKKGKCNKDVYERVKLLLDELKISINDRKVIEIANKVKEKTGDNYVAIMLDDGKIITGRSKGLMTAGASCVLNSLKYLTKTDDSIELLSKEVLKLLHNFKLNTLNLSNKILTIKDVLFALTISSNEDPICKRCIEVVNKLKNTEVHSTCMLNSSDRNIFRSLNINFTEEPIYEGANLYNF